MYLSFSEDFAPSFTLFQLIDQLVTDIVSLEYLFDPGTVLTHLDRDYGAISTVWI